jgi:hypothetical protein
MREHVRGAALPRERFVWLPLAVQLKRMIEFVNRSRRIHSAKIARNDMSSDQPPGDLAGSGQGDATLLILRWTGCCVRPNPKANAQIWRSNELDPRAFQRLPNLLNGIKVGLDATFRTLQPAYGRKRQAGFPGQLVLPPSEERASCLDLSRVNEHLCPLIPSGNRCEIQNPGGRSASTDTTATGCSRNNVLIHHQRTDHGNESLAPHCRSETEPYHRPIECAPLDDCQRRNAAWRRRVPQTNARRAADAIAPKPAVQTAGKQVPYQRLVSNRVYADTR